MHWWYPPPKSWYPPMHWKYPQSIDVISSMHCTDDIPPVQWWPPPPPNALTHPMHCTYVIQGINVASKFHMTVMLIGNLFCLFKVKSAMSHLEVVRQTDLEKTLLNWCKHITQGYVSFYSFINIVGQNRNSLWPPTRSSLQDLIILLSG